MIINNPFHLFQNTLISITKTGNFFLDYIINFIILSLMTYLLKNIDIFKKTLYKLFLNTNKDNVRIIIETKNASYERGGIKYNKIDYPKKFQAITYYIKKIKPNGIYSKIEPDKTDKDNKLIFDIFIPDQEKSFIIDTDKNIHCIMKLYENNNYDNKNEIYKTHKINLFSKDNNTTIDDLELFVENCVLLYDKYIYEKELNEQYHYCYINGEENGDILNYSKKKFFTNKTFDSIYFDDKEKYLENLDFFINNREWYESKGIPYHFGVLLYGEPGCGKTSILKATIKRTGRYPFVIPFNRVETCGEAENIFYQTEIQGKNIPIDKRIYIFEDIDCLSDVIKERSLEKKSEIKYELELLSKITELTSRKSNNVADKLTLSCLLNIFDGILETPGRIIILTTNYPDKIDKALLRPGRIDINIELKKASSDTINRILSSFYDVDTKNIIFEDYILTPATVSNICLENKNDINNSILIIKKLIYNILNK